MKTTSRVFAWFFLAIGIAATLAALGGATHQWALAGLSYIIYLAVAPETIKTER